MQRSFAHPGPAGYHPRAVFATVDRSRLYRRLALVALGIAVLVFVAVSMFGIDMPVQWGHYGHHIGEYTLRARGTLRYHTVIPAHWSGPRFPPISSYYLHHGILPHQFLAIAFLVFGDHVWVVRLVPICWGLASLLALFVLVRRHWGNAPAAVAALTYATLPFTAAFSIHYDEGQLALPATLIALDAWLRFRHTPRLRLGAVAVAGFFIAAMSEWTPYFYTAVFCPIAFVIGWSSLERYRRKFLLLRPSQWLVFFMGLASVLALGFHMWFVRKVGAYDDLVGSYHSRSANSSWSYTVDRQLMWFMMYFGKPLKFVIGAWGALLVVRLATLRGRARDLVAFTLLGGWMLIVVFFAMGVNIHSYRVMPLSGVIPLAAASLVWDLTWATRRVLGWLPVLRRFARLLPALAAVAAFGWLLKIQAPMVRNTLLAARRTAGTIEFEGYGPHLDSLLFAQKIKLHTPRDALVVVHPDLGVRPEFMSLADREISFASGLGDLEHWSVEPPDRPIFVAWDQNWLSSYDRTIAAKLLAQHGAFMLDGYILTNLRREDPSAEAWHMELGKPSKMYRYFVSWDYPPWIVTQGIRLNEAAWLGTLGVRVLTRDTVQEPSPDDLSSMVGYVNYLRARGDSAQKLADAARKLAEKLHEGTPLTGVVQLIHWGDSAGQPLRLVLGPSGSGPYARDLRVVLTLVKRAIPPQTQAAKPPPGPPNPPAAPQPTAPPAPKIDRFVRTPAPDRPEYDLPFWRAGSWSLWNVALQDLDKGTWRATLEIYNTGKGPPNTPKPVVLPSKPPAPKPPGVRPAPEPTAAPPPTAKQPVPPPPAVPEASCVLGTITI